MPVIAWRFILKSTLWLWWILLFIGGAPNVRDGIRGLRASQAYHITRISLALGLFGVAIFFGGNLFKPTVMNAISTYPVLPVVAVLFLADWNALPVLPALSFLSGLLAISIWIWADIILKNDANHIRADENARALNWISHLIQWKAALFYVFLALTVTYIGLYAAAMQGWITVSDFWLHKLGWIYGPDHIRVFHLTKI
jgi:hypothetical protein